jgi:hypothetical protein
MADSPRIGVYRGPLYALAAAIVLLAGALLWRGDALPGESRALGQIVPRAGGGGLYLMPGQLTSNAWGVYLLDTDTQALLVYRFEPAGDRLELAAARSFVDDRALRDFNTWPPTREITRLIEQERQNDRVIGDPQD